MAATLTAGPPLPGVVAVLLVNHQLRHRAWAWLQLVRGVAALAGTPGLRFAKVMGSGQDGGFGLRPSATHQALVTLFDTRAQAEAFVDGPRVQAYRERAQDWWSGVLAITSSRGSWDGCTWDASPSEALAGELPASLGMAALTRASIRPGKITPFWRLAPPAQRDLARAPGCELAMGLGEAPLLRQCTFSLWRDEAAMTAYAHSGAHGQAVKAAHRHDFFSESMFVRMRVLRQAGHWQAVPPAAPMQAGDD